jgi:hypothetical protein
VSKAQEVRRRCRRTLPWLDLDLSRGLAGHEQRPNCREAGAGRALGRSHPLKFELVLLAADVVGRA